MSAASVHFAIGGYPPSIGGAQIQTQVLAHELARRGSSVRVSCHWRETRTDWVLGTTVRLPSGRRRETDAGVAVDQVGLRGGRRVSDVLLAPLYYPLRPPVARRFASRLDFDDGDERICHIVRMGREHLLADAHLVERLAAGLRVDLVRREDDQDHEQDQHQQMQAQHIGRLSSRGLFHTFRSDNTGRRKTLRRTKSA